MRNFPPIKQLLGSRNFLYLAAATVLIAVNLVTLTNSLNTTTSSFTSGQPVSDNVFSTGQLALKLSDANELLQDSVSATWAHGAMRPGDVVGGTLFIRNSGSVAGSYIAIDASNTVTEAAFAPGNALSVRMDTVLELVELRYDGADIRHLVDDTNGNGILDLGDMAAGNITGLPLTDLGTDHTLDIHLLFHPGLAMNEHHGDQVITSITVTLLLDPSP